MLLYYRTVPQCEYKSYRVNWHDMSATFDAKQKSNLLCFRSCFLVNSADRVIRVYESGEVLACGKNGEPEPIQKLQDLVNK